jgi:type II secretory pathway component PulM
MHALAAQAKALQGTPAKSATESRAWLETSVKQLGKATITMQGGRAQINFNQASPEQLTAWLVEARTMAALRPIEAHWKRFEDGKSVIWDGVVVFELGQ